MLTTVLLECSQKRYTGNTIYVIYQQHSTCTGWRWCRRRRYKLTATMTTILVCGLMATDWAEHYLYKGNSPNYWQKYNKWNILCMAQRGNADRMDSQLIDSKPTPCRQNVKYVCAIQRKQRFAYNKKQQSESKCFQCLLFISRCCR